MNVDIIMYAEEAARRNFEGMCVVVIDVFRATSVMTEALNNGARAVVPAADIETARVLAANFAAGTFLLGGERDALKIEGFDLGNSPLEYTAAAVKDKTVILSTTNGTRAVENSREAVNVFIASLLNYRPVCRCLASHGLDIALVCSGRQDRFTAEDGLCAGAMAGILSSEYGCDLTDAARAMYGYYASGNGDLSKLLEPSLHYNDLLSKGFGADIDFCLRENIYDSVPYLNDAGEIVG